MRPLLQRWAAERDRGRGPGRLLPAAHGPPRDAHGRDRPRAADDRPAAAGGGAVSGRALVLAAHGSRRDPAANALVRRLAESLRGRRLFDEVAVAFHQGEPGFDAVLDELDGRRGDRGPVPHQRRALQRGGAARGARPEPALRRACGSGRRRRWAPMPGVAPLVARRVTELLREQRAEREDVGARARGTRHRAPSAEPRGHRAAGRHAPAPPRGGRGGGGVPRRRPAARRGRRPAPAADRAGGAVPHRRRRPCARGHPQPGGPGGRIGSAPGQRGRPARPDRRRGRHAMPGIEEIVRGSGAPAHAATGAALPAPHGDGPPEGAGHRASRRRRPRRSRASSPRAGSSCSARRTSWCTTG